MYSASQNFVTAVIDEIALEGLDGITVEGEVICFIISLHISYAFVFISSLSAVLIFYNISGLWTRLSYRPNFTCALDDKSKAFLWNIIRQLGDIEMYELPSARKPLVVFNRYDNVDPELGIILEPVSAL
jgi:hypothetical protein